MRLIRFFLTGIASALFTLCFCGNPVDPSTNPIHTDINITLTDSEENSGTELTDSTGEAIQIKLTTRFPHLIDSVTLEVGRGNALPDTIYVFKDQLDTIEQSITFEEPGEYTLKAISHAYKQIQRTASGSVTIIARPNDYESAPEFELLSQSGDTIGNLFQVRPETGCSLLLSFKDPKRRYTVEFRTDIENWSYDTLAHLFLWTPSHSDTGLQVVAVKITDDGRIPRSDEKNLIIAVSEEALSPAKPIHFAITGRTVIPAKDSQIIRLSWDNELLAESYTLYRSAQKEGPFITIEENITDTAFSDYTSADSSFYYFLTASNSAGLSVPSDTVYSADKEATEKIYYTLTLDSDTTRGRITADPKGGLISAGDTVRLTAHAEPGFVFTGWEEGVTGTENPLNFEVNADATIRALFAVDTNAASTELSPGESLNEQIKDASDGPANQMHLLPEPGFYDRNTIEVKGKVTIFIRRK